MMLKVVFRKVRDYFRYDLKEIAFPSSLPDPSDIKKSRKLTYYEWFLVVKEGSRVYGASWVRDIGPELRPNEYKKEEEEEEEEEEESEEGKTSVDTRKGNEPSSTLEDLAVAARGGMETLRPALQRLYMTRASSYKDSLQKFILGYQEGIQQVMDIKKKKQDSNQPSTHQ